MLVRVLVLALLASADPTSSPPCRAARAPLPSPPGLRRDERAEVERYRVSWRRACDPAAPAADLGSLLGDAEALIADVSSSRTLAALAQAHAAKPGAEWPLPGIVRDEDGALDVDWASFGAVAERGTAEDRRFWRGAGVAADHTGEPSWLGEPAPGSGAPCVRLGEVDWPAIADALDAMERAGSEPYVRHARELRSALVETMTRLARGPEVCACLPTRDAAATLEPLAAGGDRLGTPARRALAKASGDAMKALKSGRARVRFLRQAPDAPPTGCGTAK
jgi:hypothetical protein